MGEWKSLKIASGTGWKEIEREAGSGWKALEWESAYEDFTTFTEVDIAADRIQKSANHVDYCGYRDEETYLYKDYGVAHFGNFTHKIKMKKVTGGNIYDHISSWMLANDLDDQKGLKTNNKTYIMLILRAEPSSLSMFVRECRSGTNYTSDTWTSAALDTWYYVKIVKSSTSLNCYVYSDSNYSTLVHSFNTLTLGGNWTFRYLYPVNTYNDNVHFYGYVDIENYDLG